MNICRDNAYFCIQFFLHIFAFLLHFFAYILDCTYKNVMHLTANGFAYICILMHMHLFAYYCIVSMCQASLSRVTKQLMPTPAYIVLHISENTYFFMHISIAYFGIFCIFPTAYFLLFCFAYFGIFIEFHMHTDTYFAYFSYFS